MCYLICNAVSPPDPHCSISVKFQFARGARRPRTASSTTATYSICTSFTRPEGSRPAHPFSIVSLFALLAAVRMHQSMLSRMLSTALVFLAASAQIRRCVSRLLVRKDPITYNHFNSPLQGDFHTTPQRRAAVRLRVSGYAAANVPMYCAGSSLDYIMVCEQLLALIVLFSDHAFLIHEDCFFPRNASFAFPFQSRFR